MVGIGFDMNRVRVRVKTLGTVIYAHLIIHACNQCKAGTYKRGGV